MAKADITRQAIAAAMKRLMAQQPLEKISVKDIVAETGLGRNSFYYHFKDKYDLVNWIFDTEITRCIEQLENPEDSDEVQLALLEFFWRDLPFYKNALEYRGQNSFMQHLNTILRTLLSDDYAARFPDPTLYRFYVEFYIDGFLLALVRWVCSPNPQSPEKVNRLLTGVRDSLPKIEM